MMANEPSRVAVTSNLKRSNNQPVSMAIRHCKQQLKRLWEGKHCGYGSGKVVDSKSSSSPDNSIAAATQTSKKRNKQLVVIAVTAGTAAAEKGGGCGSKARQQ